MGVSPTSSTLYLYDGRIAEYEQDGTGHELKRTYLWGMDLSGSMQGAGGVGGLLSMTVHDTTSATFYPTYDGNGNVSEYIDDTGAAVAHFEYDPFGNLTVDSESNAAAFPYRFSTKPQDLTTGLYYYGYRYYDPVTGRWPSRDPIEEEGGLNLYGFVYNSPFAYVDILGLSGLSPNLHSGVQTQLTASYEWWLSRVFSGVGGKHGRQNIGQVDSYLYTLSASVKVSCWCGVPTTDSPHIDPPVRDNSFWSLSPRKLGYVGMAWIRSQLAEEQHVMGISIYSASATGGGADSLNAALGGLGRQVSGHVAGLKGIAAIPLAKPITGMAISAALTNIWGILESGDGKVRYDFIVTCEKRREGDPWGWEKPISVERIFHGFGVGNRKLSKNYLGSVSANP